MRRRQPLAARPAEAGSNSSLRRAAPKRVPFPARRRVANAQARRVAVQTAFARDYHRCQWPKLAILAGASMKPALMDCYGPLTPHEPGGRGRVDANDPEEIVTLCARHNDLCEDEPEIAREIGLRDENRNARPLRKYPPSHVVVK